MRYNVVGRYEFGGWSPIAVGLDIHAAEVLADQVSRVQAAAGDRADYTTVAMEPDTGRIAAGSRFRSRSTGVVWRVDSVTECGQFVMLTRETQGRGVGGPEKWRWSVGSLAECRAELVA